MTQSQSLLKSSISRVAWLAIGLLLLVLLLAPKAHAMTANTSNGGCAQPAAYSGGAPVAKVFYPADGSTVTVTSTGAVIKQSPCGTAYREGWVNTADMCCLNSYDDLPGRIQSGSSNPYASHGSSCSCNAAPATVTRPTQAVTTTTTTTTTPQVKAASTTSTTTPTPAAKATSLPNTGSGNVLVLGGVSTLIGAIGHYFYRLRRSAH